MTGHREFKIPSARGEKRQKELTDFSMKLRVISGKINFRVSVRGWCYLLEGKGLITKAEFKKAEKIINECRNDGYLPIDFIAEDAAREFDGVEIPYRGTPLSFLSRVLNYVIHSENGYNLDWWEGEEYYIQMAVEKVDLKTLFQPVCKQYHIPIANMRGQSSKLQRADMARRFKDAESRGMQCVLLYCGDLDPDGCRISESLKKNINDLKSINWEDRTTGYNPENLIIERFGLNADFIMENRLSWIPNLITGSKKNLADFDHRNNHLDYVQDYINAYGERKCESNALVTIPAEARDLCRAAIERHLGGNALTRFRLKRENLKDTMMHFRDKYGITDFVSNAMAEINAKIKEEGGGRE
jgi:hypothetical protein